MLDNVFYDTNIFVYLGFQSKTETDRRKREISRELLISHQNHIFISYQVLNETSNVLLRKSSLEADEIIDFLKLILNVVNLAPFNSQVTFDALELHSRHQFAFYDSLIVASAIAAGCSQLITEDLQNQQVINFKSHQLQVINPFD